MTDKQILGIASERAFDTRTAPGFGTVILLSDAVWLGREIEKETLARANKAFLKVLHLVNNGSVKEASEIFIRELSK